MENKTFTIYSISTKCEVFYIGRTCNLRRRKTEHLRESHKTYNTYKVNKIRKLQKLGESIEFNILHENLNYDDSVRLEIEEIKTHKDNGAILTNLTDGGEGLYGMTRVFTDEWKDKLKQAKKEQFDNGYVVYNKGKKLEEIAGGKDKADDIINRYVKTRKENFDKGLHKTNKGKNMEDVVGKETAAKMRIINSETAKKTFTGTKQTIDQINKKVKSMKETLNKRTEEQKETRREQCKLNGSKSIKMNKFIINNEYEFIGTWKSLSQDLKENLGIIISSQALSNFYHGKYKTMKCGITKIEIID